MNKIISLMFHSFPFGSFLKVPVYLHWSFLYIVLITGVSSYVAGGVSATITQLEIILAVYACVFLHEFGHILTSRYYGIGCESVTLSVLGGLARLDSVPRGKIEEFNISIAGPLVNAALIAIFYFLGILTELSFGYRPTFFNVMIMVNTYIFVFNMLPAYPMDGGRILRSLLSMKMDFLKATRISMYVANVFLVGFLVAGFYLHMPMLIVIAIFLFFGARVEYKNLSMDK